MEMHEIQLQATKEAMQAKQDHEIDVATRRVDALAQQVHDRATALMDLVSEVRYQSGRATEERLGFHHGAFGRDAETLDDLVKALAEESGELATMRTARDITREMQGRYEGMIREEQPEHTGPEHGFSVPGATEDLVVPTGAYI